MNRSNDTVKQQKLVQNFFTKTVLVIAHSRLHPDECTSSQRPVNRWFNLELPAVDSLHEKLRPWKVSNTSQPTSDAPPPMVIEVYLDTSRLGPGQYVILPDSSLKTREEIVLERWVLQCEPLSKSEDDYSVHPTKPIEEPAAVYKRGVSSIRSLYTLARLLPTWTLRQRLVRQRIASIPLRIGVRVNQGSALDLSSNGLDLSDQIPGDICTIAKLGLEPIATLVGMVTLRASYRNEIAFKVSGPGTDLPVALDKFLDQCDELPDPRNGLTAQQINTQPQTTNNIPHKPVLAFTRPFKAPNVSQPVQSAQQQQRQSSFSAFNSTNPRQSPSPNEQFLTEPKQRTELADFMAFLDETSSQVSKSLSPAVKSPSLDDALDVYKRMQTSNTALSNSITGGSGRRFSSDMRSRLGFYRDPDAEMEIDKTILNGLTRMDERLG